MDGLQRRSHRDTTTNNVSIFTVDPGTRVTGRERLAPWSIRVPIFTIILYFVIVHSFSNGPARAPHGSASNVLEATFACSLAGGDGDGRPQGLYVDGRKLSETSTKVKDTYDKESAWKETIK